MFTWMRSAWLDTGTPVELWPETVTPLTPRRHPTTRLTAWSGLTTTRSEQTHWRDLSTAFLWVLCCLGRSRLTSQIGGKKWFVNSTLILCRLSLTPSSKTTYRAVCQTTSDGLFSGSSCIKSNKGEETTKSNLSARTAASTDFSHWSIESCYGLFFHSFYLWKYSFCGFFVDHKFSPLSQQLELVNTLSWYIPLNSQ